MNQILHFDWNYSEQVDLSSDEKTNSTFLRCNNPKFFIYFCNMFTQLDCIALRTVRYNDRHDILVAYSRQAGRVSFLLSSGRGREAARRRALLMPMSRFECISDIRPGGGILSMRDLRAVAVPGSDSDPVRGMIALFVGDLLSSVLTEPVGDDALFRYLEYAVVRLCLTRHDRLPNFHISFMVGLMRYLGIEPDVSTYADGELLDMTGGEFRATPPLAGEWLDREASAHAARLLRMNFRNMHLYRLSCVQRNEIVDHLIRYYTRHHRAITSLRSLDVLRSL